MVLSQNTKRDSGKKVQLENINAGKTIGDVIRTCLGPRAMLKMLMDPMGGIVMTNDGNAILREITVQHPAAKTMIEISRTKMKRLETEPPQSSSWPQKFLESHISSLRRKSIQQSSFRLTVKPLRIQST